MRISKFSLFLILVIIVLAGVIWFTNKKIIKEKESSTINISLNKLRGVTKLVIWEQDFTLSDLEEKEKNYFGGLFTTKESLSTTIQGKMGFHIDLADSIHTHIQFRNDTIFVNAPLQVTYVNLDLSSLQQIKDASIDPSINIKKEEVIKKLDTKALEQYLPVIAESLRTRPLTTQQEQLSKLAGKPVKINITSMPQAKDWESKQTF